MENKITDNIFSGEFERNVCRLKAWTPEQRQIRLENLCMRVSQKQLNEINSEVREICDDENFFRRTSLNYSNPDVQLIKTALLDYLLD